MVVVAAVMSFFLPGMMVARAMRSREWLASGVVVSLLVLFESVLLLEVIGVPITIGPVLGIQALVLGGAVLVSRRAAPAPGETSERYGAAAAVAAMSTGVVGLLALRTWLQPVSFLDVWWRWDFIARRLLTERNLAWYPPVSAVDFTRYGYADGIPPMVSLGYWVPYAALGEWAPSFSAIFVGLQYAAVLWATFRVGRLLHGEGAGLLSVAVLLSSRAFFGDVAIGQDTGLTTLAMLTMAFHLLAADRDDRSAMALAGACAACGALTREYALAYIFLGAGVARLRGQSWRGVGIFLGVACVLAAPWYVRNLVHTGNPFYDNPTGGIFPNNPVHVTMLKFYGSAWTGGWDGLASELLKTATLPLLLGLAGFFLSIRRSWPLLIFACVNVLLFVASARYTASGPLWAARVLAPSWALLAVAAGGLRFRVALFLLVALLWSAVTVVPAAMLWPTDPAAVPLEHWRDAALFASAPPARRVAEMRAVIEQRVPHEGLILSDDMNIFASLVPDGWTVLMESNPAVRFLFDPSLSGADAGARLRAMGVRAVCIGGRNGNLNRLFLDNFPFFRDEVERWPVIYENAGARLYMAP